MVPTDQGTDWRPWNCQTKGNFPHWSTLYWLSCHNNGLQNRKHPVHCGKCICAVVMHWSQEMKLTALTRVNQSNAKMSAVPTIISLMSAACAFPGQFTDRQVVLLQCKQQPWFWITRIIANLRRAISTLGWRPVCHLLSQRMALLLATNTIKRICPVSCQGVLNQTQTFNFFF